MFCKHEWKVMVEKLTESKAELSVRLKMEGKLGAGIFNRKSIIIMACQKCGKVDKTVTEV